MKQTQTKLFDFSDFGLDFCAGSKNLFPDRFKKMLAQGYNTQTVANVAVSGNQVTLTYGTTHGYVASRVLKVNSGALASINGGEFWIDSVTTNTLTFTLDDAPISITGNFTTHVASLGWQLVYEQAHIHIYKFKHIDDTDMYARLCFQNTTGTGRNCIAVGIGRTVNLTLGHITDQNCMTDLATCATVAEATSHVRWDFSNSIARTFDNYTYSQGASTFGKANVVGSLYHFACMYHQGAITGGNFAAFAAIMPFYSSYSILNYPVLFAQANGAPTNTTASGQLIYSRAYVGQIRVTTHNSNSNLLEHSYAANSFLPAVIDGFNTTTCITLPIFTYTERQYVGCCAGVYQSCYAATNAPSVGILSQPSFTQDIDLKNNVSQHYLRDAAGNFNVAWLAIPIEEIKIA